ncbi:hypothetical protein FTUN_8875 [Frigoriglobus tundricola]|uniref:Uncharacterized protein n=2 Tax=Frigoriglobus tundricola TaxID=2774151 RepID=A0A6M5Z577_9BACT|nr:hypothetical protein FTUN_8875 [Frigoriglobus tundricola]
MCPSTPPGPNTPPFDLNTLPPKLRALYDSARRLAQIRAEMIAAGNLARALQRTPTKNPASAEVPAPAGDSERTACDAEGTPPV